jgi:hypothetical protein
MFRLTNVNNATGINAYQVFAIVISFFLCQTYVFFYYNYIVYSFYRALSSGDKSYLYGVDDETMNTTKEFPLTNIRKK